jgi:hypothetical protein
MFVRTLTLILLTWTIWRAPTNASKWRMGFNSAFKGLMLQPVSPQAQLTSPHGRQFLVLSETKFKISSLLDGELP